MYIHKYFVGFISFLFFALLVLYFFHPIPLQDTNVDLGHHLLLGKITLDTRHIPETNFISFTEPLYRFINTQWLSELVFYGVQQLFGYNGLIILSVLLMTCTFGFLFWYLSRKSMLFPAAMTGLFTIQMLIDRTEIKPELFSFLFVSIFLTILYQNRETPTKWIFLLPILEIIWVNMHIFFIVGIGIAVLFFIDSYFSNNKKITKEGQRLLISTVLIIVGSACNPNGIIGVLYPLHVFQNYGYTVIENLNIISAIFQSYADITFFYFIASVCFLLMGVIVFHKKLLRIDIILSLFFTFLGCFAVRDFPLFAIGTFISLVKIIGCSIEKCRHMVHEKNMSFFSLGMLVLVTLIISPAVIKSFQLHNVGLGVIDNANQAIQFLEKNNIQGPIFNNYNIGNYLEYRLYPKEKVFVDGNPEQYPKDFFRNVYYPMEGSYPDFVKLSKQYHINVVFYEHKNQTQQINPVLTQLVKSNDWKMVYINSSIVIFVRNNQTNQMIIKHTLVTEQNFVASKDDLRTKDTIGDLSNIFRIIGWYNAMVTMDVRYLDFDPKNCTALRHVATVMNIQNNPLKLQYIARYQNACTNI